MNANREKLINYVKNYLEYEYDQGYDNFPDELDFKIGEALDAFESTQDALITIEFFKPEDYYAQEEKNREYYEAAAFALPVLVIIGCVLSITQQLYNLYRAVQ